MCEHWMAWVSNYTVSREAFREIYNVLHTHARIVHITITIILLSYYLLPWYIRIWEQLFGSHPAD